MMNSNQWRVSFWGILILVMLFGIHQNNQYITREAQEIFTEANFEVIDEVVWEMASQYQSADYSPFLWKQNETIPAFSSEEDLSVSLFSTIWPYWMEKWKQIEILAKLDYTDFLNIANQNMDPQGNASHYIREYLHIHFSPDEILEIRNLFQQYVHDLEIQNF